MNLETIQNQPETERPETTDLSLERLTDIAHLKEKYASLISEVGFVDGYDETTDRDAADYIAIVDDGTPEQIKAEYTNSLALKATMQSWWHHLSDNEGHLSLEKSRVEDPAVLTKYSFEVRHNGEFLDQGFDIYDIGEPSDTETLSTISKTLTVIDEFSGGALAANKDRFKVALFNGVPIHTRDGNGNYREVPGKQLANANTTFINTDLVFERAKKANIDPQEYLSMGLIHELLGHGFEKIAKGSAGTYFKEHFDYSAILKDAEIFAPLEIHESITAKDLSHTDSHPTTEYGYTNSAEDYATATEGLMKKIVAPSLDRTTNLIIERREDAYRSELILELMQEIATAAKEQYAGTSGAVATEITPVKNRGGEVTGFAPARQFEVIAIDGATALKAESQKILDGVLATSKPHPTIYVDGLY